MKNRIVPKNKKSKRAIRAENLRARRVWDICPVTRVPVYSRAYRRAAGKQSLHRSFYDV